MALDLSDGTVRRIVQEELLKLQTEKQRLCHHGRSGVLQGGVITCDDCGKVLSDEDRGPSLMSEAERKRIR